MFRKGIARMGGPMRCGDSGSPAAAVPAAEAHCGHPHQHPARHLPQLILAEREVLDTAACAAGARSEVGQYVRAAQETRARPWEGPRIDPNLLASVIASSVRSHAFAPVLHPCSRLSPTSLPNPRGREPLYQPIGPEGVRQGAWPGRARTRRPGSGEPRTCVLSTRCLGPDHATHPT